MRYFLTALVILLFPFIEHFFRGAGFVSMFATIALALHIMFGLRGFAFATVFLSFILDTTFHQFFGTHLLSLGAMLLIYEIMDRVIPSDTFILRSLIVLLSLFIYMLVSHFAVALSFDEGLYLQSQNLTSFALKAVMGMVIYHVITFLTDYMRTDNKSTLKMR